MQWGAEKKRLGNEITESDTRDNQLESSLSCKLSCSLPAYHALCRWELLLLLLGMTQAHTPQCSRSAQLADYSARWYTSINISHSLRDISQHLIDPTHWLSHGNAATYTSPLTLLPHSHTWLHSWGKLQNYPRREPTTVVTRMWANAQPDGRPAEHRWRPLFNAASLADAHY